MKETYFEWFNCITFERDYYVFQSLWDKGVMISP